MSRVRCPYCTGTEGRCSSSGSGRFITECVSCGRVVEERRTEVEELFVERARDSPLCIVTPDFSDNQWKRPPPMEDDPFESIGFITAFSTWSLEFSPLFTSTTTTFCGHLAELERVLLDSAYPPAGGGANSDGASNNSLSLVDNLRAYLQIVDVSSILGLDRDISDHAIQLFRDCSCTTYLRNRNIEALATAALVQAIREAQEPRTLQEISAAANVQQKEIGKYIKILGDALKLSQPINSNSISVHMPRFCSLLQLSKTTQDLATHIGEVVINKSFCTRRNPISISAAAIYLSCQLEDKRKTQAEICKVTGLTEVTLRKVYKELLENWYDLLPTNYTPAVPPERAFPMTAAALGRASATRTDVNGGVLNVSSVLDSSVPMTSGFSGVTGIPDGSHGVGSGPCNSSALQSFAQASGSATSVNVIPTSHFTTSTSSSDGKGVGNMFAARSCTQLGNIDSDKRMGKHPEESDKDIKQDTEKEIEGIDSGINSLGNLNFTTQSSTGISNFRPSCFPFEASIDPRIFQEMNPVMWPSQLLYGMPAFRPEENKGGQPSNRKNEDAWHATTKGYSFFGGLPNSGEIAMNIVPFNSSPQFDFHQTTGNAQNSVSEKDQKNEIQRDRGKVNSKEVDSEREGGGTGGQYFPQLLRGSPAVPFNAFVAAASGVSSSGAEDFPPNIWSFLKPSGLGPLGILPHQMPSSYGTLLQGLPQPVQMHIGTEKGSLPIHGDKPSSGIDATAGVGEALSGLSYANIATGMPLGHTKGSQPTSSQPMHSVWTYPFHQSLLPALNAGSHAYGGRNDGSVTLRRDVLEGNVVSNTAHPRHSGEVTGSLSWPSSDGQGTNGGLNSSFSEDRTMG